MKKKDIITMILAIALIILSYAMLCVCKDYNAIKDGEQNLSLYKGLISYLIENNPEFMNDAEYIAIDANTFNITSEQDKKLLTSHIKKYHDNVLIGNLAMLEEPHFSNEDGSLKGVYISASDIKIQANKLTCTYTAYKANLNSVGYEVKATYHNGKWKVKYQIFVS